jgi:hypothetical protein
MVSLPALSEADLVLLGLPLGHRRRFQLQLLEDDQHETS